MPDLTQKQLGDSHSKWSKVGARLKGVADSTSDWRSFRGSGQDLCASGQVASGTSFYYVHSLDRELPGTVISRL